MTKGAGARLSERLVAYTVNVRSFGLPRTVEKGEELI